MRLRWKMDNDKFKLAAGDETALAAALSAPGPLPPEICDFIDRELAPDVVRAFLKERVGVGDSSSDA